MGLIRRSAPRVLLPDPQDVRELGNGKARIIRRLFAARCTVAEIAEYLAVKPEYVSNRVRLKAGNRPLILRSES